MTGKGKTIFQALWEAWQQAEPPTAQEQQLIDAAQPGPHLI